MTRLLGVELRRLTARRLVQMAAVVLLVGMVVSLAVAGYQSNRDFAGARADAERAYAQNLESFRDSVARCEADKAAQRLPADVDCGPVDVAPENFGTAENYYVDPRLSYVTDMPNRATGLGFAAAVVAFLVGATYVGAEWAAGTMQALLFWEPRRLRVLLAKAVALVLGVVVVAALAQLLQAGVVYSIAATRGTTEGVTGGFWNSLLLRGLRMSSLAGLTSLVAFGIAGLLRNTGAALGAGFVYFAIIESAVRGFRPGWDRWLLSTNLGAWAEHGLTLTRFDSGTNFGSGVGTVYELTFGRAVLTLAVYLGLLLTVFAIAFRRRDVT